NVESPFDNPSNPLLINNKVKVVFEGITLKNVFKVKTEYIRDNNKIYIFKDNKLKISNVKIVYSDENYSYVESGLANSDKIVTTNIPNAIEGLMLEEVKLDNEQK
ncbi:MAG: hypothetical protein H5U39_02305, partial [Deferribacterales bacterium]|nr:hypothetical protein [Deferribacterales bacterium]